MIHNSFRKTNPKTNTANNQKKKKHLKTRKTLGRRRKLTDLDMARIDIQWGWWGITIIICEGGGLFSLQAFSVNCGPTTHQAPSPPPFWFRFRFIEREKRERSETRVTVMGLGRIEFIFEDLEAATGGRERERGERTGRQEGMWARRWVEPVRRNGGSKNIGRNIWVLCGYHVAVPVGAQTYFGQFRFIFSLPFPTTLSPLLFSLKIRPSKIHLDD